MGRTVFHPRTNLREPELMSAHGSTPEQVLAASASSAAAPIGLEVSPRALAPGRIGQPLP